MGMAPDHGLRSWLEVKVNRGHRRKSWVVLFNGVLLLYSDRNEEQPEFVYPLHSAVLSFPSPNQLIVHYRGTNCELELVSDTAVLLQWHLCISAHIKEWKSKRRLSVLFRNRMRFAHSCKLDSVGEDYVEPSHHPDHVTKEKETWMSVMERVESAHRLRELSLVSEENRSPWASLPEVIAAKCTDQLSEEELQSNELLFSLVVSEVIYNQELSRLVDLARASVRWKDSLPLFNRRSIIGCSLKVKKCSDLVVRTLEEEWLLPHSLVTDLGRIFSILEAGFNAVTAQSYVAYCDNLDDARTLFTRATQRDSVLMSSVVSSRCHIELALLPIQRLSQLKASLEQIRRVLPSDEYNQPLLQCRQLYVTVSGIIELCYKVLTSLHGSAYLADIENMLDFSNKLSTLRLKRHKSIGQRENDDCVDRPQQPLPRESCSEMLLIERGGNVYTATPTLKVKTVGSETTETERELNESFNLIDLQSMENLLIETKVDSVSSSDSVPSSSSGLSSPGDEYELIELKEIPKTSWAGDDQLLQKSFEMQPLYQAYNTAGKGFPEIDPSVQSKSIFYAYLDLTENVYEDINESAKSSPLQPLRTLWCETEEVVNSGILNKLTPSQIALQESKFEILTSEVSYLKSLNILITLFVESSELKDVLDCEDRRNLFSNILEVRKASEIFLFDLAGQWEEDFMLPDVCSVIQKHAQGTFRVYIEYCSNQVRFHRTLQRLMLDSQFMPVLSLLEGLTACQGYSLQSFLMLPVQRVTGLPLLIQAIQRRVPVGTPEFATCRVALMAVNQLVHECNEGVRTHEQSEQIQALSHMLHNDDTKEREENKINSATPNKSKKDKTKKKRHSSLPWKIFSSNTLPSDDA